jgi:hypothetical protein
VFINNARWDGVPFLLKAGKALHSRVAEIRVQFRHVPGNLYRNKFGVDLDKATNELVGVWGGGWRGKAVVVVVVVVVVVHVAVCWLRGSWHLIRRD